MKRLTYKNGTLSLLLLIIVWLIVNTVLFVCYQSDKLFGFSNINDFTIIHINIDSNFDINDIGDLVHEVTGYDKDKIIIKRSDKNGKEISLKMKYTNDFTCDQLIERLNSQYNEKVSMLDITHIHHTIAREDRTRSIVAILITLVIIIVLVTLFVILLRNKKR